MPSGSQQVGGIAARLDEAQRYHLIKNLAPVATAHVGALPAGVLRARQSRGMLPSHQTCDSGRDGLRRCTASKRLRKYCAHQTVPSDRDTSKHLLTIRIDVNRKIRRVSTLSKI